MSPNFSSQDHSHIQQVVDLLHQSKSLLFITGAGLSADSGLPTYRGITGLYENRNAEDGMPIETLLSRPTLESRPDLTWKYLLQIEQACRNAQPNRGHHVIAEMETAFDRVWVLTQNVDGLHHRAGSKNVIDIHGDLHGIRCTLCNFKQIVANYQGFTIPPKCPECKGNLRPEVVLFGEMLPLRQLAHYQREIGLGFDLVFSIGTTSIFPYIAAPMLDAYQQKKPSIEINPGETQVSEFATVKLNCNAATALEAIWTTYQEQKDV